jgi:hypothetical protein
MLVARCETSDLLGRATASGAASRAVLLGHDTNAKVAIATAFHCELPSAARFRQQPQLARVLDDPLMQALVFNFSDTNR